MTNIVIVWSFEITCVFDQQYDHFCIGFNKMRAFKTKQILLNLRGIGVNTCKQAQHI